MRILTDPTFDSAGAKYPTEKYTLSKTAGPRIGVDEIGQIDAVLLSHDHHFDNLDNQGRKLLSKCKSVLTTQAGAARLGGNTVGLEPWQTHEIEQDDGSKLRITATPARHGPTGSDRGPVIGFIIESKDFTRGAIYLSGDTVWFEGIREIAEKFTIQIAVLFMGAARVKEVSMQHLTFTANEGVAVASLMPSASIAPVHYEDWMHFTEGRNEIEGVFRMAGIGDRLSWIDPEGMVFKG